MACNLNINKICSDVNLFLTFEDYVNQLYISSNEICRINDIRKSELESSQMFISTDGELIAYATNLNDTYLIDISNSSEEPKKLNPKMELRNAVFGPWGSEFMVAVRKWENIRIFEKVQFNDRKCYQLNQDDKPGVLPDETVVLNPICNPIFYQYIFYVTSSFLVVYDFINQTSRKKSSYKFFKPSFSGWSFNGEFLILSLEKKIYFYNKHLELKGSFEVAQSQNVVFLEKLNKYKIIVFTCGHSKASEGLQFFLYELNVSKVFIIILNTL